MLHAPDRDCNGCPRLVVYRLENRKDQPDWHNAPVESAGSLDAQLLIAGLAPGRRGANRTGRPFTGDFAGDLLYSTLIKYGFAKGNYAKNANDGMSFINCRITNVVRCVPPQNKPTTAEITACRPYLKSEFAAMPNLRVILALGGIAHRAVLKALGHRATAHKFAHHTEHQLLPNLTMINSYHCSRLNTNTGRLTESMFHHVFDEVRTRLNIAS